MVEIKIGVICEGPTDFWAIKSFYKAALEKKGIVATFVDLQPNMDETRPTGGWGQVFRWLERNPPTQRIVRHIGGGLFSGTLDAKSCDLFLLQMDADIVEDRAFQTFFERQHSFQVPILVTPRDRGAFIKKTLRAWASLEQCTRAEENLHALCAAVESTETWCVAVFSQQRSDPETLKGENLVVEFMRALHVFESRSHQEFSISSKDVVRRKRYCEGNERNIHRLERQCFHFQDALRQIMLFLEPRLDV